MAIRRAKALSETDAAQGITPEMRAALDQWDGSFNIGAGLEQSLGNLSPADTAAIQKKIEETAYAPGQLDAIKARDAQAATNARFGNDMAWLDPQFQMDPQMLGTSERSKVYADPNLVEDQQRALDSLFGIAKDGGATAQERARRAKARGESENWLRGQREADMQNLAERGMSGSGAELLTLAKDRQDAAQRNSAADLDTDAWLEQRALDATMKGGELAGQMRDTGFQEGLTRAGAQDEFYQLNQKATNDAKQSYADYQRNAHNEMLKRRDDWDKMKVQLGLQTAGGLMSSDIGQGQSGYDYAGGMATGDTNATNAGIQDRNAAVGAPVAGKQDATLAAHEAGQRGTNAGYDWMGKTTDRVVSAAAGGAGGGGAGAAAGGSGGGGGGSFFGSGGSGGDFNWQGIAQGVASDDDDEKKAGSYA